MRPTDMAPSHFPDHATQLRQAPSRLAEPALAIIIVNWNGWRDVVECLETIFNNKDRRFRVIVCDNASSDGSIGHFIDWAAGLAPVTLKDISLSKVGCSVMPKHLILPYNLNYGFGHFLRTVCAFNAVAVTQLLDRFSNRHCQMFSRFFGCARRIIKLLLMG